jgi:hypothetical protein
MEQFLPMLLGPGWTKWRKSADLKSAAREGVAGSNPAPGIFSLLKSRQSA